MPAIDLSILNQRQTPAFYADVFANRPAAGFVGRIFVSTDTFAFYRDNGTGWDLIGGPGTGTITGSGASGQIALWSGASTIVGDTGLTYNGTDNSLTASKFIVTGGTSSQFLKGDGSLDSNIYNTGSGAASQVAFFSGTNAISGENNLWWDSANNHLGINTNTPATALDVNHNGTLVAKFNNTTTTSTLLAFENAGNEQWWIGTENTNNDFLFYDATNFPTLSLRTTFKTSGQVLIGGGSTGSGKLVVESAASDNGIQIVGANAPSLRIDSTATGPTKRIGLGISTGVNNFIQGSVDRDMCIFNGSTTASPMLFGIYDAGAVNVQEAARISAARNFLIGTTIDDGSKLKVAGNVTATNYSASGNYSARYGTGDRVAFVFSEDYYFGMLNPSTDVRALKITAQAIDGTSTIQFYTGNDAERMRISKDGNVGIARTNPEFPLDVNGDIALPRTSKLQFTGGTAGDRQRAYFMGNGNNDIGVYTPANNIIAMFHNSGNTLLGKTTDSGQKLQVSGTAYIGTTVGTIFQAEQTAASNSVTAVISQVGAGGNGNQDIGLQINIQGANDNDRILNCRYYDGTFFNSRFSVKRGGIINMPALPTSSAGLSSGDLWNNSGVVNIIP